MGLHRPLSQQLNYDDRDDDESSDHALLRSLPETPVKAKSKSFAISHSPYLVSYSPVRKGVAPTETRKGRSGSEREGKSSKWGFQKLRSSSSASSKSSDWRDVSAYEVCVRMAVWCELFVC